MVDLAREMLHAPVELLPWALECVQALAQTHTLMLITKGDAHDQASKLERSGLQGVFLAGGDRGGQDAGGLCRYLRRATVCPPERLLMVGNSLRSDILPVIELGGQAVYVPYWNTWAHENTPPSEAHHQDSFHEIEHLGQLEEVVRQMEGERG